MDYEWLQYHLFWVFVMGLIDNSGHIMLRMSNKNLPSFDVIFDVNICQFWLKTPKITIIWTIFDHNTTFSRFMVLTLRERKAFSPFLWTSRELNRKRTSAAILEWFLLRTLYYDIYTVKTRISSRSLSLYRYLRCFVPTLYAYIVC